MFKFGFDHWLGLPDGFAGAAGCDSLDYRSLDQLIDDFSNRRLDVMFLPAGTLPYLTCEFQIIAQATTGSERLTHLNSRFISAQQTHLSKIEQKRIGRINQYCTTSYWAPLIHFMTVLPESTPLTFYDADGFVDMFNKTVEGQFDFSCVWDVILQNHPDQAANVKVLFEVNELPAPIIIAQPDLFIKNLDSFTHYKTDSTQTYFNGFTSPDIPKIKAFKAKMQAAGHYFKRLPE